MRIGGTFCNLLWSNTVWGSRSWKAYSRTGLTRILYAASFISDDECFRLRFKYQSLPYALQTTESKCRFHFKSAKNVIPKYLCVETLCKGLLLIWWEKLSSGSFLENVNCTHFPTLAFLFRMSVLSGMKGGMQLLAGRQPASVVLRFLSELSCQ